jgi:phosphate transport system permease protein
MKAVGNTSPERTGSTGRVDDMKDRISSMDSGELTTITIGTSAVVVAFVLFFVAPAWATIPSAVFVLMALYGWYAHQALTAKSLMFLATISTVLILGLITVYLFLKSAPAFRIDGLSLILDTSSPFEESRSYSLVPMIWGTIVTTILATSVAGPFGVMGALFISVIAPNWAREIVKPGIEMLAGIPSIVYGYIGFMVVNKYIYKYFNQDILGSLLGAGLVIGVMALPTVVSVAEDAISSVPAGMRDGSTAMGATDWQTMKSIIIPASSSGISAAVLLGVGRAIGETMAVTVMLGKIVKLPEPIYDVFGSTITLTSYIASSYGSASGLTWPRLYAAGVILFITVTVISIVAQLIELRVQKNMGSA